MPSSGNFWDHLLHAASWAPVMALVLCMQVQPCAARPVKTSQVPRPTVGRTSPALARALAAWDKGQAVKAGQCANDADSTQNGRRNRGMYSVTYTVLLDSPEVFSVGMEVSALCGGPYPVDWHGGLMFNPNSGARIDAVRLYEIATAGPNGYEFKPQLRSMLREALLARLNAAQRGNACTQIVMDDRFRFLEDNTVVLGKTGLHILYSGPHVSQFCYRLVVLPYGKLRSFLNLAEARKRRWPLY